MNGGRSSHTDGVLVRQKSKMTSGIPLTTSRLCSGHCHQAFFQDPDGNQLILHHRYAPPDARCRASRAGTLNGTASGQGPISRWEANLAIARRPWLRKQAYDR